MHHELRIAFGQAIGRPFHVQCACGTSGDFEDKETARGFAAMHIVHLQGINHSSITDETIEVTV